MSEQRPLLVDLFCKAGGAAMGYYRAGFDVLGVDIEPQPNYPFEFVRRDALDVMRLGAKWISCAAIHASPPCQWQTAYKRRPDHVASSPEFIRLTQHRLARWGKPYVIESPASNAARRLMPGAVQLCGSSFGLDVRRHRLFESNVALSAPSCDHAWQTPRFAPATNRSNMRRTVEVGVWRIPLDVQQRAMGIDWMTREELSQAIPPAYTEYLGRQLLAHIQRQQAA